jgi:prolyl-tRNA synthetase
MMRCVFFATAAFFLSLGSVSAAVKPCAELKAEIAAKLDSKGVKSYELSVADKNDKTAGKVVGTCEDGRKKIVYSKQQPAAAEKQTAQQHPMPVVSVRMVPVATDEQQPQSASSSVRVCADVKAKIATKLDSKGVKNYTLIIINKNAGSPGQVVGACENGSKKIIYAKTR